VNRPMSTSESQPDRSENREMPSGGCAAFETGCLNRELTVDSAIRWGLIGAVIASFVVEWLGPQDYSGLWSFMVIATMAAWIGLNLASARVAQRIPYVTALIEHDPEEADRQIASLLKKKPLQRVTRLLLYHRLAIVRQLQGRLAETAAICEGVLAHHPPTVAVAVLESPSEKKAPGQSGDIGGGKPVSGTAQVRAHLLLMAIESRMECGDPAGAYWGLIALHGCSLNLVEILQLLALQTRYEVTVGHYAAAVERVERKIELAELMPTGPCGALHGLLAAAAGEVCRYPLADWLGKRSKLMCTDEHLQRVEKICSGLPSKCAPH